MKFVFSDIFTEIAALLFLAALFGAIGLRLKQPLIVSFIALGIFVGPSGLELVSANDQVDLLAKLGIALLLFVVGLKLDMHIIRTMGPVALATGLGQVFFTSVFGYLIALALGISPVGAVYVAVALTFSSTIIIVKLLSDKREVNALHGRIALGFLIVQDIVVVLVMIGLTAFGQGGDFESLQNEALKVLVNGTGLILAIMLLMRYVLPHVLRVLVKSQELLLLFAIAWAVSLATIGVMLGFSKEVGAFLAGVSIASSPYKNLIAARMVGLRDFLLLFFFIDLGAQMDLSIIGQQLTPALIFSVFVLLGNPLIVMVIMGYLGYRKRTGFLAGLAVAQISEFSLILGALGVKLGHITPQILSVITLVGVVTISISTYMIIYSHQLYEKLAPWMGIFERKIAYRELQEDIDAFDNRANVILIGLGRFGTGIADILSANHYRLHCIDFNPDLVHKGHRSGNPVYYGDAEDPEFISTLSLAHVKWVISTADDPHVSLSLLQGLNNQDFQGKIAVTAHNHAIADKLEQAGADLVLIPYEDAGKGAAAQIMEMSNKQTSVTNI
ncbi:sodium:proton exchanger [Methyloprofundus sedimenti]|uniref:Sodium:proton exchanger n=1 Tax=Methyloprofundus sedimenti TaxID=1420851 RepID=A0A1V8M874_9GAMM|nr:cation:proton antiporter family protein [Methyloprofundus sedimenti]OQK17771.1 sodium:proton exchanger [Methyloprofundus sedimenti]